MSGHHHRSGSLRQSNKKNKRSKSSKRSVTRVAGGKVEGRVGFKQRLVTHSKADRRHIQQQKRDAKRQDLLRRKRGLDGGPTPPRIVGIISLGESTDTEEKLRSLIVDQADALSQPHPDNSRSVINAKFEVHKKEGSLTVLTNSSAFQSNYASENRDDAAVMAALDLCRVCDMILFVIDGNGLKGDENILGISIGGDDASTSTKRTNVTASQDFAHLLSDRGDRILAGIKGQGLPRALTILAQTEREKEDAGDDFMTTQSAKSIRRGNLKRRADLKKYVSRFASTEFGVENEKVIEIDLTTEHTPDNNEMEQDVSHAARSHVKKTLAAALVRTLCTTAASPPKWISNLPRAYVLADGRNYNIETQELQVTGFVRGIVPFDINALIHIPNLGTFACKSVKKASHPFASKGIDMEQDSSEIFSDPMKRESLEMFATPDALDGEQNLIGFDEDDEKEDDNEDDGETQNNFARPAGWSDYQSAWLDAVDDATAGADAMDHGELAKELNKKSSAASTVAPDDGMDLDDANQVSEEERQALREQRRKEQHEHQDFPDEVELQDDEKARDRFARYRSLKSFRKSQWDPKENLPESYATIYNIPNFKATQRSVMSEMKELSRAARDCDGQFWDGELKEAKAGADQDASMDNNSDEEDEDILQGCIPSGSYVTLTIEGVSQTAYSGISPDAPITAVTLMPHENKASVLHMGLSQSSSCEISADTPVKSKDLLTFRCGWRTWTGRPVFSQNNLNCDKHKFERFVPQVGSFFAASVFGPVTYTPCPVLVFRDHQGRKELVAIGSMMGADADRIVIKRIVLTGFPVRVRKRYATVKYMFSDPEDVKWFKPAGLTTKHGLHGNIDESVGEHGTMKCLFNAPIKQHDTVCLPLYKRIYPKFEVGNMVGDNEGGTVRTIRDKNVLMVR